MAQRSNKQKEGVWSVWKTWERRKKKEKRMEMKTKTMNDEMARRKKEEEEKVKEAHLGDQKRALEVFLRTGLLGRATASSTELKRIERRNVD